MEPSKNEDQMTGKIINAKDDNSSNKRLGEADGNEPASSKRQRPLDPAVAENCETIGNSLENTTGVSAKRIRRKSSKVLDNEEAARDDEVVDLAVKLGLKGGDRIEVEWEIVEEEDQVDQAVTTNEDEEKEQITVRWWGATLQEHDGRSENGVAIRVLEYDPYPEGGFPESSREEVFFFGRDLLVSVDSQAELKFRPEGAGDMVYLGHDDIREELNSIMMSAMSKHSKAWNSLTAAQQAIIAEKVSTKKEKLIEALQDHTASVITPKDMKNILCQVMEN